MFYLHGLKIYGSTDEAILVGFVLTQTDRASVVGDAIDYIRELIRTVNELKLLVEKKRYAKERYKRPKTEEDAAESCNIKPFGDPDGGEGFREREGLQVSEFEI